MTLDVAHAHYAGGGPGYVVVRLAGRARAPAACRLAPPTLLIADGAGWRRLAAAPGTAPLLAGPDAPDFLVDVEVPLHLLAAEGEWWLEPGAPLADGPPVEDLRRRIAELRAEVAALRERVSETTAAAPTVQAARVPKPRPSRLGAAVPVALVAAGALAVADAVATVVWQEPISALMAGRAQHGLHQQLAKLDRQVAAQAPAAAAQTPDPQARMAALARALERQTRAGRPLGELRIPRIGARQVVVQGTAAPSLREGPGHYFGTPLPGEAGTVGIAGHRTTYGAPFRHIDALRRGDAITLRMPYGTFVYRVYGRRIVRPEDVSSLRAGREPRLVLTACHPLYSAAKRIVVLARLQSAQPRGATATPRAAGAAPAARSPQA